MRDPATGAIIVDENSRLPNTIATVQVGKTNGSYTLPAGTPGTPSYIVHAPNFGFYAPEITRSGQTLSWTWKNPGSNANQEFEMEVGVT